MKEFTKGELAAISNASEKAIAKIPNSPQRDKIYFAVYDAIIQWEKDKYSLIKNKKRKDNEDNNRRLLSRN